MASSSGGRNEQSVTGSRFEIFNKYGENFPEIDLNSARVKSKRKRAEQISYSSTCFFSKNQKLDDLIQGPKYVLMKRTALNEQKTLTSVSPFLVMKCIEHAAGKPKTVKLLRDGSLLIHTTSKKQADKLYKLTSLTDEIQVHVAEHPTLNCSKGTIFCRDIIISTDDEIKEGLKDQNVIDVHRMTRRDGDKVIATGLFVLTFDVPMQPTHVNAGYERIEVREYIPNPRRCFNCQRYGHGAKTCTKQGTCGTCSEPQHAPTSCVRPVLCPNCQEQHPAWDRKCKVFKQEYDIQRIQTTLRISNYEARKRYINSNPITPTDPNHSFSNVINTAQISEKPLSIASSKNPLQSSHSVSIAKQPLNTHIRACAETNLSKDTTHSSPPRMETDRPNSPLSQDTDQFNQYNSETIEPLQQIINVTSEENTDTTNFQNEHTRISNTKPRIVRNLSLTSYTNQPKTSKNTTDNSPDNIEIDDSSS